MTLGTTSSQYDNEYFNKSLHTIDINVISQVQRTLSKHQVTSLAYLLYDTSEVSFTALERLTLLQDFKHQNDDNLDLLVDWVRKARNDEIQWKYKFLEALAICQLYNVVKRLGFSVTVVKSYFEPDNIRVVHTINLAKKALYKLADNMTCNDLERLKNYLADDNIKNDQCELIFLKLELNKTISITNEYRDLNKLINIFKTHFKALYCKYLEVHDKRCLRNEKHVTSSSTPSETGNHNVDDMLSEMLAELNMNEHLKSDKKTSDDELPLETYPIKCKQRIGLCHIINQEKFSAHPQHSQLDNRDGSSKDKIKLKKIMTQLKFNVKVDENLSKNAFMQKIKSTIHDEFLVNDSIYMLCILSHGIKGHVYGADCCPINLDVIKETIDSNSKLQGVPKVIIIQACQENSKEDSKKSNLQADGPNNNTNAHYIPGSDFLIYWATAPEYQAYRLPTKGSIFIQILCIILKKFAACDLYDIFTKVNLNVNKLFSEPTVKKNQLPLFESTLLKKIYLKVPS